jgi:hypothetical protein
MAAIEPLGDTAASHTSIISLCLAGVPWNHARSFLSRHAASLKFGSPSILISSKQAVALLSKYSRLFLDVAVLMPHSQDPTSAPAQLCRLLSKTAAQRCSKKTHSMESGAHLKPALIGK